MWPAETSRRTCGWGCSQGEEEGESQICVINFKGKASYFTEVREQRRRRRRRRREEEEEEGGGGGGGGGQGRGRGVMRR